ncbi:MAG: IclR family transcriptional regulator C-terminal domain-containing protein [Caldilineaceae bacterium]
MAWPYLQSLRDQFNETINLGMLDNMEIVYIDMAESRHSLRMQKHGWSSRDPIYSTALGKAIWPSRHRNVGRNTSQNALSHAQPKRRSRLARSMMNCSTRARGTLWTTAKTRKGRFASSAPIFDHSGHVRYALSLSAPASAMSPRCPLSRHRRWLRPRYLTARISRG